MQKVSFEEIVEKIVAQEPRYHRDAYDFVREALEFTQQKLQEGEGDAQRHVTGQQLLEGIRLFALGEYGPMAQTVLNSWGIMQCDDFGEIVFRLIDHQVLRKTDADRRDHFSGGYDFDQAFRQPFLPAATLRSAELREPGSKTL